MAFTYETQLGPPNFGKRKGTGMVILHTTESTSTDMAGAKAIATLQTKGTLKGSYNKIIATNGVLTTVPDTDISGGVNPFSTAFSPQTKSPWLYNLLPAYKVNDPNSYALELSFMGIKANWDKNGWPPQMIDAAARLILAEEKRIGGEVVVVNHGDFQTNRTDAGPVAMNLVMKRYQELVAAGEDEVTIIEVTLLDPQRHVGIPANTNNLQGWDLAAGKVMKTYNWPDASGFDADALITVTQNPDKQPSGQFVRAANGIYKGLSLDVTRVRVDPAPAPPEPVDCSEQVAAAVDPLNQQIAALEATNTELQHDSDILNQYRKALKKVLA